MEGDEGEIFCYLRGPSCFAIFGRNCTCARLRKIAFCHILLLHFVILQTLLAVLGKSLTIPQANMKIPEQSDTSTKPYFSPDQVFKGLRADDIGQPFFS